MTKSSALIDWIISKVDTEVESRFEMTRSYTDQEFIDIIEESVLAVSSKKYIDIQSKNCAVQRIFNARRRLDILQPFIDDSDVDEIMVNGMNMIFTERKGVIRKEEVSFISEAKLYDIIQSIVSRVDRTVNESSPIVDARLPDGSRVNVALPPVALNGPVLTIRKFRPIIFSMEELVHMGFISREAANFLIKAVESRKNIFISGGAGTGKTTFLNVLTDYVGKSERVITIEDSAELRISSIENVVRLEARSQVTDGAKAVTVRDLLKAALRMRPDRIIVGEIRSSEALDMLQAMNTGHDGSLSTGHANSALDMLSRIETMAMYADVLPVESIRKQIASAVDILVHLERMGDASRRISEILEVVDYGNGKINTKKLFTLLEGKLIRVCDND